MPPGAQAAPLRFVKRMIMETPFLRGVALRALSRYRRALGPRRLRRAIPGAVPLSVVLGAGSGVEPGWIATEREYLDITAPADWERFFRKGSIDTLLAEHVFEHMTPLDAHSAARLCFEYLKPGGRLRAAVPDGNHPDPAYRAWVEVGGIGPGARDHKVLYDYHGFRRVFADAGFEVRLLEYWDEQGVLHQADWDPAQGHIRRSIRFDTKDRGGFRYSSIILDASKAG